MITDGQDTRDDRGSPGGWCLLRIHRHEGHVNIAPQPCLALRTWDSFTGRVREVPCRYDSGTLRAVPRSAWEGVETVYFPYSDLNNEVLAAIEQSVPDGGTFGINHDYRRCWVMVTKPGNTRAVLHAAFASLGLDLPDDHGEA